MRPALSYSHWFTMNTDHPSPEKSTETKESKESTETATTKETVPAKDEKDEQQEEEPARKRKKVISYDKEMPLLHPNDNDVVVKLVKPDFDCFA